MRTGGNRCPASGMLWTPWQRSTHLLDESGTPVSHLWSLSWQGWVLGSTKLHQDFCHLCSESSLNQPETALRKLVNRGRSSRFKILYHIWRSFPCVFILISLVCVHAEVCGCPNTIPSAWRSENSFHELVFFLHHASPGHQIYGIIHGGECLYPLVSAFTHWTISSAWAFSHVGLMST